MSGTLTIGKREVYYEPKFIRPADLLRRRELLKEKGYQEIIACYQCYRHAFACRLCNSKYCRKRPGYALVFNLKIFPLTHCRKHPKYLLRLALIKEVLSDA